MITEPVGQAIQTKFLAPTDTRGSRVKASAEAGSVTLEWSHTLNSGENHAAAAEALIAKLGWSSDGWHGGGLPSGGYAFIRCR